MDRWGTGKVNGHVVLHGAEKLGREASSACLVQEIQVCALLPFAWIRTVC